MLPPKQLKESRRKQRGQRNYLKSQSRQYTFTITEQDLKDKPPLVRWDTYVNHLLINAFALNYDEAILWSHKLVDQTMNGKLKAGNYRIWIRKLT